MSGTEEQAKEVIKEQIVERLQEIASTMAKDATMFFGWNHTTLPFEEVVKKCIVISIYDNDKTAISFRNGVDHEFVEKHMYFLDKGTTETFTSSAWQTVGMVTGALDTASKIGRGKSAKIDGNNAISFPSLMDMGMAVNALTTEQDKKIDLSGLGKERA